MGTGPSLFTEPEPSRFFTTRVRRTSRALAWVSNGVLTEITLEVDSVLLRETKVATCASSMHVTGTVGRVELEGVEP